MIQSFQEMNLPPKLNQALTDMGYKTPTPIQAQAIPVIMEGRDLIGCAETGTGKTAAYCIPLFQFLLKNPTQTGLILVPTRELAQQIEGFWRKFSKYVHDLNCAVLMGGMSMRPQFMALQRKPRLIIATPGRLIDHLQRRSVQLTRVGILVLDEADRMLDMGFKPQLEMVLKTVPVKRQSLLFSATWSPEVDRLSRSYLQNPEKISAGTINRAAPKIEQRMVSTTVAGKNETLLNEINKSEGSILIFVRTQARTDRVANYLYSFGLPVNCIHGGRSQGQRRSALQDFKNGRARILVATDVASRGIDVVGIAHVINYDLPNVAEDYIHRIGRTARAGASGNALSLVTREDQGNWKSILRLLQKSGSRIPEGMALDAKPQYRPNPHPMRGKQGSGPRHQARTA